MSNKKISRLASLLVIPALALSVSACGGGGNRDAVIFYVWGDNAELACYEKIAKDFTEETGKKVNVQVSTGDYYDNLNVLFSSKNTAPDIFFTESGELPSHLASSKIMNLSPYIESGALDVKSPSNPDGEVELWDINDAYRYDGEVIGKGDYYALIKDWSPDFMLWYNKSHIDGYNAENNLSEGDEGYMQYPSDTVPMTWDEFYDMSYKLRKTARYGTMLDRVPYKHLMEWVQMTGSSVWAEDNKNFNSNDPDVYKAFKFFCDLQIGEKASAPIIGPTGVGSGEAFANGNVSFVFFGNWAYSTYNWNSVGFELGYCPSPVPAKADGSALTENDTYAACSGMISLAVYKNTTLPDDAVEFLNYYMTHGNRYMAAKGFNIPGNKAVANSPVFTNPEDSQLAEINQYFLNVANKYTHPIVYNTEMSQLSFENIIGKHMSDYLANPKGGTLQQVLDGIASDVKREL